jgi:hypothetical protein
MMDHMNLQRELNHRKGDRRTFGHAFKTIILDAFVALTKRFSILIS